MKLKLKKQGHDIWLHVDTEKLKASINLGHRPDNSIVQRTLEQAIIEQNDEEDHGEKD